LPEYYPTRTERSILMEHRDEIARVAGPHKQLVDLGAGDCAKADLLLPVLNARRYIAVDIAAEAIQPALSRIAVLTNPSNPGAKGQLAGIEAAVRLSRGLRRFGRRLLSW